MDRRERITIPCLYDPQWSCHECRWTGINQEDLERLTTPRKGTHFPYLQRFFNNEGFDFNLLTFTRLLANPGGLVFSSAFEKMVPFSTNLKKLGENYAKLRQRFIVRYDSAHLPDGWCPVYRDHSLLEK